MAARSIAHNARRSPDQKFHDIIEAFDAVQACHLTMLTTASNMSLPHGSDSCGPMPKRWLDRNQG